MQGCRQRARNTEQDSIVIEMRADNQGSEQVIYKTTSAARHQVSE